jgi:hypothetical protein
MSSHPTYVVIYAALPIAVLYEQLLLVPIEL